MKYSKETKFEELSIAIPIALDTLLQDHLIRKDKQEDVAFALYKPSHGLIRFSALIHQIILPEEEERNVHGNVEISSKYFKRACMMAAKEKSGIVLLHSHTGPGWQGMSMDDFSSERSYASTVETITGLPFVGLTLATDRVWSGRFWEEQNGWYERRWAATVRVVGKHLKVSFHDGLRPEPAFREIYKRTATVWGMANHGQLARLRIGIVGLGSVGSIVAESLARMGVERLLLLDFDEVQLHNLDRLLGATESDVGLSKVLIAHRQILKSATAANPQIKAVISAVTEEDGYRNVLDCDLLFSCVDRPWPRQIQNHIAYNHLIPVIDGGIQVRFDPKTRIFKGADWQAQVVGPERPCLQCLKVFNPSDVGTEKAGLLDDPTYLEGLPVDHGFKRNENIFPYSMNLASLEVMQFIEMVTGIADTFYYGTQRYTYNQGFIRTHDQLRCEDGCLYQGSIALGDSAIPPSIGLDHSAEKARKRQS